LPSSSGHELMPFLTSGSVLNGAQCTFLDFDHASATPAASGARHSISAPEAKSMRGLRRDAEGSQGAETLSEAPDLSSVLAWVEQCKDTFPGPSPHRQSCLFCIDASAQW